MGKARVSFLVPDPTQRGILDWDKLYEISLEVKRKSRNHYYRTNDPISFDAHVNVFYVIMSPDNLLVKIGHTSSLANREAQRGLPFEMQPRLVLADPSNVMEKVFTRRFARYRVEDTTEWFFASVEIKEYIREVLALKDRVGPLEQEYGAIALLEGEQI